MPGIAVIKPALLSSCCDRDQGHPTQGHWQRLWYHSWLCICFVYLQDTCLDAFPLTLFVYLHL